MTLDVSLEDGRAFKVCAYCGFPRVTFFSGRRWLCDGCAKEHFDETRELPASESSKVDR